MVGHLRRILSVAAALVFLSTFVASSDENNKHSYILLGVSGGLQDGFPDHVKVDYHSGQHDEVQAVFIGKALVRGAKAFLDVSEFLSSQFAQASRDHPFR